MIKNNIKKWKSKELIELEKIVFVLDKKMSGLDKEESVSIKKINDSFKDLIDNFEKGIIIVNRFIVNKSNKILTDNQIDQLTQLKTMANMQHKVVRVSWSIAESCHNSYLINTSTIFINQRAQKKIIDEFTRLFNYLKNIKIFIFTHSYLNWLHNKMESEEN